MHTYYRIDRPDHSTNGMVIARETPITDAERETIEAFRFYVEIPKPLPPLDVQWQQLVQQRNDKLAASDWTQLPDVLLTAEQVTAWREYRQALRAWPDTVTDPWNPPPFPTASVII
jgi:hypothetical protein